MKIWEAGKVENSVTSPYEIDKITGSGYKCSECKNSKNFDGEFHLYRLYYKEDEVWDFDYEIDVPIHIECSKCASENTQCNQPNTENRRGRQQPIYTVKDPTMTGQQ